LARCKQAPWQLIDLPKSRLIVYLSRDRENQVLNNNNCSTGGAPCQIKDISNVTIATMNGRLLTAPGKAANRCNVRNAAVPIFTGPISVGRSGGQGPAAVGGAFRAEVHGSKNKGQTFGGEDNVT
jgi:hypothetical protein